MIIVYIFVVNSNSLICLFFSFAFGNNNTALYRIHCVGAICLFPWCAAGSPSNTMRHLVTFKLVTSQTVGKAPRDASGRRSRCWTVARWRRRAGEDSAQLRCRERVGGGADKRDQTEHSEQLPGVNYITSLCDTEASERSCWAMSVCVCVCCYCMEEWMPRPCLK